MIYSTSSLANLTICRTYVVEATHDSERTGAISKTYMVMTVGCILGPLMQSFYTALGDEGYAIVPGYLNLNMYNASGYVNTTIGIVILGLFLPGVFKVFRSD